MSKKKTTKNLPFDDCPVAPQMRVMWPGGSATVYSFDVAWHMVMDVAIPASTKFVGWVRREDAERAILDPGFKPVLVAAK